jgi:hypothetical protein
MATEPHQTTQSATPQQHPAAARGGGNDKLNEDKKRLAQERDERQKQMAEHEKNKGTPTPTQEECDLAKLGHHPELANDGSGPDPTEKSNTVQHIGGKYSHRSMQAKN